MSAAALSFAWQSEQAKRVSTYVSPSPEIPNDGMCAGKCSQPAPPPPAGSVNEPFGNPDSLEWLIIVGAVTALFVILTR